MEKSESRFSLLKELKWRKLRRKHNKASNCVTGMTGPSHIAALLWTKSSHPEVCRWTRVSGTSWCNIASKCLWFLSLLCPAAAEPGWDGRGRAVGLGCPNPCRVLPFWNAPPVPSLWKLLSSRKPPSKNTKIFLRGREKTPNNWLALYLHYFFFFLNCFTHS